MATASETTLSDARTNESATKWWARFLDPSERTLAVLLLMPTALLLSLIIVYPVCRLVWTSFRNLSLTSGAPATFAGLENYSSCSRIRCSGRRPGTRC